MIGEHPLCAFKSFKFVQVWGFLVQIILGNVSFAPEENVSSAVVGWNFYKCHQVN